MFTVSESRAAPTLGAETAPRKAFWIAKIFAGIGWPSSKKHSPKLEYTTREELQNLFDDDLRGPVVPKSGRTQNK